MLASDKAQFHDWVHEPKSFPHGQELRPGNSSLEISPSIGSLCRHLIVLKETSEFGIENAQASRETAKLATTMRGATHVQILLIPD